MTQSRRLLLTLARRHGVCSGQGNPSLATAGNSFIMQAAAGGVGKVAFGQLAQRHSSKPADRQFAKHMIDQHTTANQELIAIAGPKCSTLPTTLDRRRFNASRQLSALSGTAFDRQYMVQQVQDHERQLDLSRQQAQWGIDPGCAPSRRSICRRSNRMPRWRGACSAA